VTGSSILIVEDDSGIADALCGALEREGYRPTWCPDGRGAQQAFRETHPDLVLLDVGLPDNDGFTLCRWMRERRADLPIVIVTARDAEIDAVVGLDAGADDYVTKPFSMAVLLARVRSQLRSQVPPEAGSTVEVGPLVIDPGARVAALHGVPLVLRRREFEVLSLLAREAGRVVTRERLLADVWDVHWGTTSRSLDMHVLALRRKIDEALTLTTVRGVGYRLEQP
jgi:DNA-binding response OmpR family regulator